MSREAFLEYLTRLDRKAFATLRRSLAFDPGAFPQVYPYVERFVGNAGRWKREAYYLLAGLFAAHQNTSTSAGNMGATLRQLYLKLDMPPSIEQRFIALLDADESQLAHHLRQMVTLLKEYSINWALLLDHLIDWNSERRWVQQEWAKAFYSNPTSDKEETLIQAALAAE